MGSRFFFATTAPVLLALVASGCADPAPAVTERISPDPAAPVEGPTPAEARAAGTAEMSFFFVPSSGFAHRDPGGALTGVTVEILRDFAEWFAATEGVHVEVTWIEEERWADFYGYVRDSRGAAFGIGNVTITGERRSELDFSPPYLRNIAVLVTHEEVPELESLEAIGDAFSGLTALRYPGTLHEARLEALRDEYAPDMEFRPIASNDELVDALAAGPETFGYIDIYNYWRAVEAGAPLRRHPVGDDAAETFGIILPDGSEWTPVLEEFFAARDGFIGTPAYRALLAEHLGEELAALLSDEG